MKSDYIKGKKAEWDAPIPQHICKTCTHGKPHVDGKSIWCKKYEAPIGPVAPWYKIAKSKIQDHENA